MVNHILRYHNTYFVLISILCFGFVRWVLGENMRLTCSYRKLLWKAYTHDQHDSEFVSYVKDLRNMYNDGRADYTSEQLMVKAENKYKERVQSGAWGLPSEEQAEG